MCTFALDFETVSYGKEQPYHKSGNLICKFEFQLLAQFDSKTLTLERSKVQFFFQKGVRVDPITRHLNGKGLQKYKKYTG